MRFLAGAAALLASHATLASASLAYVLTFDPETAQAKHKISLSSLSPSIARLVLAQRAGVEDFHTIATLDDEEINAINSYGARTQMFSEHQSTSKAFLLAELDPEAESNAKLRMHSKFTVHTPPSFESTKELFEDLFQQAHPNTAMKSTYLTDESYIERTDSPIFHIASDANGLIKLARDLAAKKMSVTAILVPSGSRSSSWGTYSMPEDESVLAKRQVPNRLEPEEPLSAGGIANSVPSVPSVLLAPSNSSNSSSNYTNTKPLEGILPSCYTSKRACESNTRGCTGHGSCTLKYTNKDMKESAKNGECWACSCTSTKKNGLTTKWAGPACQKKDISTEFWLLALFTVGLVSAVGFAIGNLWSMGEQELPSVIGAGVSGPSARK